MANPISKAVLKEYFKSGKRPGEEHFHLLIDSCYNQRIPVYTAAVPAVQVLTDPLEMKILERKAGRIWITPAGVKNLNGKHTKTLCYPVSLFNLPDEAILESIDWEIEIPKLGTFDWPDFTESKKITIELSIQIEVYNGTENVISETFGDTPPQKMITLTPKFRAREGWKGLSVDIYLHYDIKTPKPFSKEFYDARGYDEVLKIAPGHLKCVFSDISQNA